MFDDFYRNRRVLVTGHTGFKGGWLSLWLHQLGAEVHGLALPAHAHPNFFETLDPGVFSSESLGDIGDLAWVTQVLRSTKPEVVFHLAAQPIVRTSYEAPYETFRINALGTVGLLESIRLLKSRCSTVIVTSDKCYDNRDWCYGYRETDRLGGHDPYAMSKAVAELAVSSYRSAFFAAGSGLGPLASARAGNVIGGGDYAVDRIVPDAVRSLLSGTSMAIRNPVATRPWQHVLDSLSGYLWLARRMSDPAGPGFGEAFNFGPGVNAGASVLDLTRAFFEVWPGDYEVVSQVGVYEEAMHLNLSIDKAASVLGWLPTWGFHEAVRQTASWYRQRHVSLSRDMSEYSVSQIADFAGAAAAADIEWAKT